MYRSCVAPTVLWIIPTHADPRRCRGLPCGRAFRRSMRFLCVPNRACRTALVQLAIRYHQNPSNLADIPSFLLRFEANPRREESRRITMVENLLQDLRFGVR